MRCMCVGGGISGEMDPSSKKVGRQYIGGEGSRCIID